MATEQINQLMTIVKAWWKKPINLEPGSAVVMLTQKWIENRTEFTFKFDFAFGDTETVEFVYTSEKIIPPVESKYFADWVKDIILDEDVDAYTTLSQDRDIYIHSELGMEDVCISAHGKCWYIETGLESDESISIHWVKDIYQHTNRSKLTYWASDAVRVTHKGIILKTALDQYQYICEFDTPLNIGHRSALYDRTDHTGLCIRNNLPSANYKCTGFKIEKGINFAVMVDDNEGLVLVFSNPDVIYSRLMDKIESDYFSRNTGVFDIIDIDRLKMRFYQSLAKTKGEDQVDLLIEWFLTLRRLANEPMKNIKIFPY